jgi:Heme/copper-type cytochrome/quinol oxidases, subunit 1
MDTSTSVDTHHEPHAHDAAHEHHELGWWRKYIFSTDHKVIGIQYGLCGLSFLFFRVLPDDDDALATGLSRPGTAGDRQMAATHFRPGMRMGK